MAHYVLCLQTTWQVSPWEALKRAALHLDCADIAWLLEMLPSHWLVKSLHTFKISGSHIIIISQLKATIPTVYFHCIILVIVSKQFREDDFTLRDHTSHNLQCSELDTSSDASKINGVNRNSILNELR